MTSKMQRARLASGVWVKLHRGVCALRGSPSTWERRAHAALLGCHDDTLLSLRTAGAIYGYPHCRKARIEVTVPPGYNGPTGVRVHRAVVPRRDRQKKNGFPITTPVRTIVDLAAVLTPRELEDVIEDAIAMRLVRYEDIEQCFDRLVKRGKRGFAALRTILDEKGPGLVVGANETERLLGAALQRNGFVPYVRQWKPPWRDEVPDGIADAAVPRCKAIFEADSRRWHLREQWQERDALRDALASAHGHHTFRFTYGQLKRHPELVDQILTKARATLAA